MSAIKVRYIGSHDAVEFSDGPYTKIVKRNETIEVSSATANGSTDTTGLLAQSENWELVAEAKAPTTQKPEGESE